jgi:hypothetical protein
MQVEQPQSLVIDNGFANADFEERVAFALHAALGGVGLKVVHIEADWLASAATWAGRAIQVHAATAIAFGKSLVKLLGGQPFQR